MFFELTFLAIAIAIVTALIVCTFPSKKEDSSNTIEVYKEDDFFDDN